MQYNSIALGGTFDRLHAGHRAFLSKAFELGEKVCIGLTTDAMAIKKPLGQGILPYEIRQRELEGFLKENGWIGRVSIVPIADIFGPAATDAHLDAIIVTKETEGNARIINSKRKEHGHRLLEIVLVEFVVGIDGAPIASTRIRMGEEDREGRVFASPKLQLTPHTISATERELLKKPLGNFFVGSKSHIKDTARLVKKNIPHICPAIITVGDVATQSLLAVGVLPTLAIVDLCVRREKTFASVAELGVPKMYKKITVENPRGTISEELFTVLAEVFSTLRDDLLTKKETPQKIVVEVMGEEDLAALPAILLAPLSSVVIYGQPPLGASQQHLKGLPLQEGLVVVPVTEKKKQMVLALLLQIPRNV